MKNYDKLYEEAEMVALLAHKNQTYDIFPYEKHLRDVVNNIKKFGYSGDYILAGWLHDGVEDSYLSYNKINRAFGENVAEMVLAVTDPIDVRSRKEKKTLVYKKMLAYPDSIIIKLADRIANVEHSARMKNEKKFQMYVDEHEDFKLNLKIDGQAKEMWDYLENLFINNLNIVK